MKRLYTKFPLWLFSLKEKRPCSGDFDVNEVKERRMMVAELDNAWTVLSWAKLVLIIFRQTWLVTVQRELREDFATLISSMKAIKFASELIDAQDHLKLQGVYIYNWYVVN